MLTNKLNNKPEYKLAGTALAISKTRELAEEFDNNIPLEKYEYMIKYTRNLLPQGVACWYMMRKLKELELITVDDKLVYYNEDFGKA